MPFMQQMRRLRISAWRNSAGGHIGWGDRCCRLECNAWVRRLGPEHLKNRIFNFTLSYHVLKLRNDDFSGAVIRLSSPPGDVTKVTVPPGFLPPSRTLLRFGLRCHYLLDSLSICRKFVGTNFRHPLWRFRSWRQQLWLLSVFLNINKLWSY